MQNESYYGFKMEYTPERFSSIQEAQKHYATTKGQIEHHFNRILKDRTSAQKDSITLVLLGKDKRGNKMYLGLNNDSDGMPYLGVFIRDKEDNISRCDKVGQMFMASIPDEKWDSLYNRCINNITQDNQNIKDYIVAASSMVDQKFLQKFKEGTFTNYTAYEIVNQLKKIDENDVEHGTYGHSLRVGENLRRFVKAMGASEETCHKAYIAGLLHDTGKLFVPEKILNKKGAFTSKERKIMEGHVNGAEFLSTIPNAPKYVTDIALFHHQLSRNYPFQNMDKEQIPKIANIAAIIDVYDALINKRTYKEAMEQSDVLKIMREDASNGKIDKKYFERFEKLLNSNTFDFSTDMVHKLDRKISAEREVIEKKVKAFGLDSQRQKKNVQSNIINFDSAYKKNALKM